MNILITVLILVLSGLFFIGLMIYIILRYKKLVKTGKTTPGIVVDYDLKKRGKRKVYYPVVEYTTLFGEKIRGNSIYGLSRKKFAKGTEVNVIYQHDKPLKFFVEGQNQANFGYLGIFFIVLIHAVLIYFLIHEDAAFYEKVRSFFK